MPEPYTNPTTAGIKRIAAARAGHVPVDHNGRPTGPPSTYIYDDAGHLVNVVPAPDTAPR